MDTVLLQARALYSIRALQECLDLLREHFPPGRETPDSLVLLGLSLGCLGEHGEAVGALTRARRLRPEDPELHASLLSAALLAGTEADLPPLSAAGALAELGGAAAWKAGQNHLRGGRIPDAVEAFLHAGRLFGHRPPEAATANRQAAAYIGETVSRMAAGQLGAAQQAYSRLPSRELLPPPVAQFARDLYTLADELAEMDEPTRAEVLAPLVALVTGARLGVRFYDQQSPVEIWWDLLG